MSVELPAEVVINEIMYHPAHADQTVEPSEMEFVELHNDGLAAIGVGGWSVSGGVNFTFPAATIPAGGYLIIAADPVAFASNYPGVSATVLGPWTGRLSNSGERLSLLDVGGVEVDEVSYVDDGDWARRRRGPLDQGHRGWVWESTADGGGSSLELMNPALTNKQGQNWDASMAAGGSPGASNSVATANIAPMVRDVKHSPAVPSSADQVRVRATLTDESVNGLSAQVFYRISSLVPSPFGAVPMFDDGLHDDGEAGDLEFAALLPAHADGSVIEFYVSATDGVNTRTWPGPTGGGGAQGANALYQVEDNPLASSASVYRIILTEEEDDEFAHGNFNTSSDAQMNATFIATRGDDHDIRYNIGLRRRGASSRNDNPRTMRANIPGDRTWDGNTAMNLNANYTYLQVFGQKLFAASCMAAQEARQIKMVINGEDESAVGSGDLNYGFHAHMEPQGSDSVARQFPDDPNGNIYRKRRPSTDLAYRSGDVSNYLADGWAKQSNTADWDWTDLDAWLFVINDTTNPAYLADLGAAIDIDQWLRHFAIMAMLNNGETNISTGTDDDYYIYRGLIDTRVKLIPHDLDTILGFGDNDANPDPQHTLFDMIEDGPTIPVLEKMMTDPVIVAQYYAQFRDLIDTSFSKENFDALVDQCLNRTPASRRQAVKTFMDQRRAHVLSLVQPEALTVETGLGSAGGFPRSNSDSVDLSGDYRLPDVGSIMVNGVTAVLDAGTGTWSFTAALNPGVNRLVVTAVGTAGVLGEQVVDVWYDDGDTQAISGTLASDTTLPAAGGPYVVTADVIVPTGVTLTVEAGASVYFGSGRRLTVDGGRLVAAGTEAARIWFSRAPGSSDTWDGTYFEDTLESNVMSYLVQSYSTAASHSTEVDESRLLLDHVEWEGTTETVLEVSGPRLDIVGCNFPSSSGNEAIHGSNLSGGDYFNLIGNFFQTSSGYNDIIDFSGGRRPGPIIYVIGNTFFGGTDDCLDLDGIDAHIEGNRFYNIHTDDPNRPSTSNAIATDGDAHITVVRNIFDNVDHALLLKNDADAIFENNVVRRATLGAISFREPLRPTVDAGSDVTVRGNIFVDNAVTFRFPDHLDTGGNPPVITAHNNIMPSADHVYGSGNLDADPFFVDADARDYRLAAGSPAIGSGINGFDMGADIPYGAQIGGVPPAITPSDGAALDVHMPGISGIESGSFSTEYRWRLDGGPLSAVTEISVPIALTGLADGDHTVDVIAKDTAGNWQEIGEASSVTWTVDSNHTALVLNEVMADSSMGSADYIEIHNAGATAVDLSGMGLSDDPLEPLKYTIPAATIVPPGGFLVVFADSELTPGLHAGFGLDADGESVTLTSSDASTTLDSVVFGMQIPDCSIGRIGSSGAWELNVPTPDGENLRKGTGDPGGLFINEWLATSQVVFCDDFIELYNSSASPVSLAGLLLSDDPGVLKAQHALPALSYIGAGGFRLLWADGDATAGADHLPFKLDGNVEWIGLYSPTVEQIDLVAFDSQAEDRSQGRLVDGGSVFTNFELPTAGLSNDQTGSPTVTTTNLVAIDHEWSFEQSDTDLGTAWRAPAYDSDGWPTGDGLLYVENSALPGPKSTPLTLGSQTYYFRSAFDFSGDPASAALRLSTIIDDGYVLYLNGHELHRLRIDDPYDHDSDATGSAVGEASLEGEFAVPTTHLVAGTNILAAEVHQNGGGSSDIVFGITLDAEVTTPGTPNPVYAAALKTFSGLRITEIMFNPSTGQDHEFIEFQNIGAEEIDLSGVRFTDGIDFVFPPATTLAPGEYLLIVSDAAEFDLKYGGGLPVAGEYAGQLSNGGEDLVMQLPIPFEANILKFEYNDSWYPLTDGSGYSLEIIDNAGSRPSWDKSSSWQIGALQGTPGSGLSLSAGTLQITDIDSPVTLGGSVVGAWSPTFAWTQVGGPGVAGFTDDSSLSSGANFSEPGTYTLRLTGTEAAFSLQSDVVVIVNDNYVSWAALAGVIGSEQDDDDCDGLSNLVEYAFGLNPLVHDTQFFPEARLVGGQMVLEFGHLTRKSDVQIGVQSSQDLLIWAPEASSFVSSTADSEVLRYTDPGGVLTRFLRLTVSELP